MNVTKHLLNNVKKSHNHQEKTAPFMKCWHSEDEANHPYITHTYRPLSGTSKRCQVYLFKNIEYTWYLVQDRLDVQLWIEYNER